MTKGLLILAGCALLAGCHCRDGGPAGKTDDIVSSAEAPSGITRRLSNYELERSLDVLIGVRPDSLDRLPPDGLGHSFDRVVESQTVSRAHIDAFFDIATEAADILVGEARLDEIAPSCADAILPPLRSSATVEIIGAALGLGPEWSVQTDPGDPTVSLTVYAPDPSASTSYGFPAAGLYTVSLDIDVTDGPLDEVAAMFGGQSMGVWGAGNGPQTFSYDAVLDRDETVVLDWDLSTNPDYHNLNVVYEVVRIEGPQDPDAATHLDDRRRCAEDLIDTLAPGAFRRPISSGERSDLLSLYDEGAGDGSSGFRMIFQGIFANASFLYLIEEGESVLDGVYLLDDYEIAARLSYALCEEPPDDTLRSAAAAGEVHTADQIETQARRILEKSCARTTVRRFLGHWLHLNRLESLNKSPEVFPEFTEEVRTGLVSERDAYLDGMFWDEDADLAEFFTTDKSWPDADSAFLSNGSRRGILEQPALLAVTAPFDGTSPVARGVFVLEQVLCNHLPPPPVELNVAPPPPDPGLSTRERWAQHSTDEQCRSCHQEIDPIGFLFEEYDGIGQFRTTDGAHPVDATGGVPVLGIDDGLEGVGDLADTLAGSDELAHCFATQWLRFSLGRLEQPTDLPSTDAMVTVLASQSMREGLIAFVRSPSFSHRYEEVE